MKHILRITILVALFCAAAVQSWANFPNPTITKGYIYGGTVKIYAQDPTTNTSQSEITDAAAGNTVYLVAEADYQHTIAGIDWRVMKSGSSKYAMSRAGTPDYADDIKVLSHVAGNVYSFTMPTGGERVTVSATFKGKPYLGDGTNAHISYYSYDAEGNRLTSNTGTDGHPRVYILDGTETVLGTDGKTMWYVCDKSNSYKSQLGIRGKIHLILTERGIVDVIPDNDATAVIGYNGADLNIYGQSLTSGHLHAIAKGNHAGIDIPGSFTLNSGYVTASGVYGLKSGSAITINGGFMMTEGSDVSIDCVGDFTFNGGNSQPEAQAHWYR